VTIGALLLVLAAALPPQDSVARLTYPEIVQNRTRTTSKDDAAIVQAIEHKLKCTCGCGLDVFTCRTTDFTCATSPAMHRAVLARLDSSMTAEQVLTAFEGQYGQSILMQPPKRGFNWAAYVMPFVALGAGLLAVIWLMRRWMAAASPPSPPSPPSPLSSTPELERLSRELEHFEA
jgi:cytochrome c-type biogenesis protein CcmH